jgi:hypothetical protein
MVRHPERDRVNSRLVPIGIFATLSVMIVAFWGPPARTERRSLLHPEDWGLLIPGWTLCVSGSALLLFPIVRGLRMSKRRDEVSN